MYCDWQLLRSIRGDHDLLECSGGLREGHFAEGKWRYEGGVGAAGNRKIRGRSKGRVKDEGEG